MSASADMGRVTHARARAGQRKSPAKYGAFVGFVGACLRRHKTLASVFDRHSTRRIRRAPSRVVLHRAAARTAISAVALVRDELVDRREADEYVHEPLHLWPGTEYQADNIPVAAHESTEAYQKPVKASDDDQYPCDEVQIFHIWRMEKRLADKVDPHEDCCLLPRRAWTNREPLRSTPPV